MDGVCPIPRILANEVEHPATRARPDPRTDQEGRSATIIVIMENVDLAAALDAARRPGSTIASHRGTGHAISLDHAYEIGRKLELERISAGWRPVGWKLGFTNQRLWGRLGLDRPNTCAPV